MWTLRGACAMLRAMETGAEIKATNRRIYKRAWMAKRRRKLKAEGGEEVRLFLPHQLVADLRKRKPKGVGLRQWLVVQLRHKVAKDAEPEPSPESSKPEPVRPEPVAAADRNKPCPCGCGAKLKNCRGERPF